MCKQKPKGELHKPPGKKKLLDRRIVFMSASSFCPAKLVVWHWSDLKTPWIKHFRCCKSMNHEIPEARFLKVDKIADTHCLYYTTHFIIIFPLSLTWKMDKIRCIYTFCPIKFRMRTSLPLNTTCLWLAMASSKCMFWWLLCYTLGNTSTQERKLVFKPSIHHRVVRCVLNIYEK